MTKKPIDPDSFPDTSKADFPHARDLADDWSWILDPPNPDNYAHQAHYYPEKDNSRVLSILRSNPGGKYDKYDDHSIVVYSRKANRIDERLITGITYDQARDICCGIAAAGITLGEPSLLDALDIAIDDDIDWQDHYTIIEETHLKHYGFKPSDIRKSVHGVEHDERPFAVLVVKNDSERWESRIYRYRSQYVSDVIATHDSKRESNTFLEDWLTARPDGVDMTRL